MGKKPGKAAKREGDEGDERARLREFAVRLADRDARENEKLRRALIQSALARRKNDEDAREPRYYHGTELAAEDWASMMDLELELDHDEIPHVRYMRADAFGFVVDQWHVTALSLH